jgi:hypothetical protein
MKAYLIAVFLFLATISVGAQTQSIRMLHVKEIKTTETATIATVSRLLEEHTELHRIDLLNWEAFSYKPEVTFRIAHSDNHIWLKYYVDEQHILARNTETNSGVSRDSCVEFFFDPRGDGYYYNFEFNCIGTVHLAYGPGRKDRVFMDKEGIERQIVTRSSLGNQPFEEKTGPFRWEMTVIIPVAALTENTGIQLKGLQAKANFYKCADDTQKPHYLSWNPVQTMRPDFHRPEFFGLLVFE